MKDETVSVVMPVHNQENLIVPISRSIFNNMSENVKEIIIIIDGCTDKTEENLFSILDEFPFPPKILYTPNIFEVLATNVGFRNSTCRYSTFNQDDMLITEKDFDKRLLKPFQVIPELLCVTARDAVDVVPAPDGVHLDFINVAGKDVNTSREIFAIRDAVNRGQIFFDNLKMEKLNYMDEIFAPQNLDDVDIGMRGYLEYGWLCGAYACEYISEYYWGTSRKNMNSWKIFEESNAKNHKIMLERYKDYFLQEKHSQDIIIK
jgi:glycosyltransferase involved in cell wall biosynthesis